MYALVLTLSLSLTLSAEQTEQPEQPSEESPQPQPSAPPVAPPRVEPRAPALETPRSPLPQLVWGTPVLCGRFPPTDARPSGEVRAQCDDAAKECLVSSARELDSQGRETAEPVARVQPCSATGLDFRTRAEDGFRFIPAVSEAPAGWVRDERGREMQFNFDLNRRVHVGGAWAPLWNARSDELDRSRYRAEFGIRLEYPDRERELLFRMRLLEGEFFLGDNSGRLSAFTYDWSRATSRPVARISTFVGKPRRFDLVLDLGGYLEALTFETFRREGLTENRLKLATAQPTFDLWNSRDLVSFVRLRAGPSLLLDTRRQSLHFAAEAALEADTTLDADGFHHLRFAAVGEKLFFTSALAGRPADPQRLSLRAEYEVIVIAINDQPLSLVLDARGGWRNDVEGLTPSWEWSGGAGLRFSLWAPARRSAQGTSAPDRRDAAPPSEEEEPGTPDRDRRTIHTARWDRP